MGEEEALSSIASDDDEDEGEGDPEGPPAKRSKRTRHIEFKVDIRGDGLAVLKYDTQLGILSAHCRDPAHKDCRVNRVLRGGPNNPAQGRPAGFLLAWIQCSCDPAFKRPTAKASAQAHMAISRGAARLVAPQLNPVRRVQARRWILDNCADLTKFLEEKERLQRHGEPFEPPGWV